MTPRLARRALLLAAGLLSASALAPALAAPPASATPRSSAPARSVWTARPQPHQPSGRFVLALGDSLAAGYQPVYGHQLPPLDPADHRRDQGYPHSYAAVVAKRLGLGLMDLGCPGETTVSFSTHPAMGPCTTLYRTAFSAPNQMAAALAVIARHPGKIALVTFDLGANDVDGCLSGGSLNDTCVLKQAVAVIERLPKIVTTIHAALEKADPRAPMVAMDYYDPFLGLAVRPGGAKGLALATASLGALEGFNAELRSVYGHDHVRVAHVASAFASTGTFPPSRVDGKIVPKNVAIVCQHTYMCPSSPKVSQDIHPNDAGYALIASAFLKALGR
ncbi:MAG: SGNH/GDSL hydrolase family protein [Actinomycetota bacterium]|nr:SGNH/GDSL hydrolase family protein [Actinomycetota bacterium]